MNDKLSSYAEKINALTSNNALLDQLEELGDNIDNPDYEGPTFSELFGTETGYNVFGELFPELEGLSDEEFNGEWLKGPVKTILVNRRRLMTALERIAKAEELAVKRAVQRARAIARKTKGATKIIRQYRQMELVQASNIFTSGEPMNSITFGRKPVLTLGYKLQDVRMQNDFLAGLNPAEHLENGDLFKNPGEVYTIETNNFTDDAALAIAEILHNIAEDVIQHNSSLGSMFFPEMDDGHHVKTADSPLHMVFYLGVPWGILKVDLKRKGASSFSVLVSHDVKQASLTDISTVLDDDGVDLSDLPVGGISVNIQRRYDIRLKSNKALNDALNILSENVESLPVLAGFDFGDASLTGELAADVEEFIVDPVEEPEEPQEQIVW